MKANFIHHTNKPMKQWQKLSVHCTHQELLNYTRCDTSNGQTSGVQSAGCFK